MSCNRKNCNFDQISHKGNWLQMPIDASWNTSGLKEACLSSGALEDHDGWLYKKVLVCTLRCSPSPGVIFGRGVHTQSVCMLETDTAATLSGAEWAGKVRREVTVYVKWVDPLNASGKIKYCCRETLSCQLSPQKTCLNWISTLL